MTNSLSHWALSLCTLMCIATAASAANPLEFFEVVKVTPSREIKHGVHTKGPFDKDKTETVLAGPQFFSHAVGSKGTAVQKPTSYLNWYEIAEAPDEPQRAVVVQDPLRGPDAQSITIGNSAFLLSPAQRVTTGTPAPIPDGLSLFKAYKIHDAPLVSKAVKLNGTLGPEDRTATRAIFLCVPVEQWHHDEHSPVKKLQDCLIVYESLPQKHKVGVTTIDQFGLNQLDAHSSSWLCVRGKISQPKPSAVK